MTSIIKKLFGTLLEKPWEESQALIDNKHVGKTFGVTNQMSAVIIISVSYTHLTLPTILLV